MTKAPETFGEQTWVLVREAYLRGMSMQDCSKLYGPKVGTIRARALRKGWTRKAHARELDELRARAAPTPLPFPVPNAGVDEVTPHRTSQFCAPESEPVENAPIDPDAVLREAAAAARRAIAGGRPAEALNLIKAAEGLVSLAQRIGSPAASPEAAPENADDPYDDADSEMTPEEKAWQKRHDERETKVHAMGRILYPAIIKAAGEIGRELLADNPSPSVMFSRFVYGWRKAHLPPEKSAWDFTRATECGWASRVFNEDGTVKPNDYEAVASSLGKGPKRA